MKKRANFFVLFLLLALVALGVMFYDYYARAAAPAGYWSMDSGTISGVSLTDLSGNNNTATLVGSPATIAGYIGQAINFDGSNDYAYLASGLSPAITDSITVSAWVKTDTDRNGRIISKHAASPNYGWMLARSSANDSFEWRISSDGTNWIGGTTAANTFLINTWYHITATYNGSVMRVYINGIEHTGGNFPLNFSATQIKNSTATLQIGRDGGASSVLFDGPIDEVKIYNSALSASEISDLAKAQSPYPGPSAAVIPGVIEAENYDNGGQASAYYDSNPSQQGSASSFRSTEGVDIDTCLEGGYNVGFVAVNEWLEYTVSVSTAGNYDFNVRAAAPNDGGGIMHIEFDGEDKTGSINIGPTGGWQTYTTTTKTGIFLSSGQHIMRIFIDAQGAANSFNLNYVSISSSGMENLIQNHGFEAGTSPWTFYKDNTATFVVESNGYISANKAKITTPQLTADTQLYQSGFQLEAGATYNLSFDAYSSGGRDIQVALQQNSSPYTSFGLSVTPDLTTVWGHFDYNFTTSGFTGFSSDTRLKFVFSAFEVAGDVFYLDNVVLKKTSFCGDLTCNGTETCATCAGDCGECPSASSTTQGLWTTFHDIDPSGDRWLVTFENLMSGNNVDFNNLDALLLEKMGQDSNARLSFLGSIYIPVTGNYIFRSDINDSGMSAALEIENFISPRCGRGDMYTTDHTYNCSLTQGWYNFRYLATVNRWTHDSMIRLYWTVPGQPEAIIPTSTLDYETWSDDFILVPDISRPKAMVDYIAAGVGMQGFLELGRTPQLEFNLPVDSSSLLKDDVWLIWYTEHLFGSSDPNTIVIKNNITGITRNVSFTPIKTHVGVFKSVYKINLPSEMVEDNGQGKLSYSFTDLRLPPTASLRTNMAMIVPYTDLDQPQGRMLFQLSASGGWFNVTPTVVFNLGEDMDKSNIDEMFFIPDGETKVVALEDPAKYRPNYIYMLSGDGVPPAENAVIKNMPGARLLVPQALPWSINNVNTWFPAYGREGEQCDVISPNYSPNLLTSLGGNTYIGANDGRLAPISIPDDHTWIAFQYYVGQHAGLPIGVGESSMFIGGGIFTTATWASPDDPSVDNLGVSLMNMCSNPNASFSWQYTDPNGLDESKIEVQVDNNSDFSSPNVDRSFTDPPYILPHGSPANQSQFALICPEASCVACVENTLTPELECDKLGYNTTYYWRVRATNSDGEASEWASGPSFSTPSHRYPLIDFSYLPAFPGAMDPVNFTNLSQAFGGYSILANSYAWTFEDATPSTSINMDPGVVVFQTKGVKEVTLSATDSSPEAFRCTTSKEIDINFPLPKWIEGNPSYGN